MKLALALLTLFSCFAPADEIDDRNRRNAERQAEESRQFSLNYRAKSNAERLRAFNGFIQNHGGLSSGTCQVATEDCSGRDRYTNYCPVRDSGQTDIRGLGASGEYIIRDCRVVTGDNSACILSPDAERNTLKSDGHWKATCTPEGGAAYLLTFDANGREYKAPPIKPPKEEKETRSSRYYGYGYYPYYGYGYGGYGSRVYNCYGEQCNYYVGQGKKKRRH